MTLHQHIPLPNDGATRERMRHDPVKVEIAEYTNGGMPASSRQCVMTILDDAVEAGLLTTAQYYAMKYYRDHYHDCYGAGFESKLEPEVDGSGSSDAFEENFDRRIQHIKEIEEMTEALPNHMLKPSRVFFSPAKISLDDLRTSIVVREGGQLLERPIPGMTAMRRLGEIMEEAYNKLTAPPRE